MVKIIWIRPQHHRRWMVQLYLPGCTNVPFHEGTLAPPGEHEIKLVLPLAHPSPQPKRQIDQFSHFCNLTAQCWPACSSTSFPLIIAPSHGGSGSHLIHASLGPSEPITQKATRSVQLFLHRWPQSVHILYNFPTLKIAPSHGDLDSYITHASLRPPESSTQTASPSVQPFLQGSLVWQTDYPARSVTTDRIYICSTAMQHNNTVLR